MSIAIVAADDESTLAHWLEQADGFRGIRIVLDGVEHVCRVRPISAGMLAQFFAAPSDRRPSPLLHLWQCTVRTAPTAEERDLLTRWGASGVHFDRLLYRLVGGAGVLCAALPSVSHGELGRFRLAASLAGSEPLALYDAMRAVRVFGSRWFFDPARWETADGTPPAVVVWLHAFALRAAAAHPLAALLGERPAPDSPSPT